MASAITVLELAHTHYFGKEPDKGDKDGKKNKLRGRGAVGSPGGVGFQDQGGLYGPKSTTPGSEGPGTPSDYLQPGGGGVPHESHSLNEDNFIAAIGEVMVFFGGG